MKKIFYLIFQTLLLISCSREEQGPAISPPQEIRFAITKALENPPADGTTFRVMAYSSNGESFQGTGTYVYRSSSEYGLLIPCKVDDAGNVEMTNGGDYAPAEGLKLVNNTYLMSLITPAVSFNTGTFNTFAVNRSQPFIASTPELINIIDYGVYGFKNPLADVRSCIDGFTFFLGEELTRAGVTFNLDNLKLLNVGNSTSKYHANKGGAEVYGVDDEPILSFREATQSDINDEIAKGRDPDEAARLRYVTTTREYIFSPVVMEKTTVSEDMTSVTTLENKSLYLQFDIEFDAVKTVLLPLLYDFEPSKTYRFNITVSTIYVNLSIEVYDNNAWEIGNGDDGGEEIGNPTETIDLGSWTLDQWENGNSDGQEEIG